jgi:hypothetical protein
MGEYGRKGERQAAGRPYTQCFFSVSLYRKVSQNLSQSASKSRISELGGLKVSQTLRYVTVKLATCIAIRENCEAGIVKMIRCIAEIAIAKLRASH